MVKIITSYAFIKMAEGLRLTFTYSVVDETGRVIEANKQQSTLVMSDEIKGHAKAIEEFIGGTLLSLPEAVSTAPVNTIQ